MASIFISYRREDTGGHAGRLFDRLTARFGDDPIFIDVQDIRPGQNFEARIDETLARCDCVVVVIGPRWLASVRDRASQEDFVRYEIAAALARGIRVVPVLVGGARMPSPADLPPDLRPLSRRHALEIRDEHFDDDAERLAASLQSDGVHVPARPRLLRARAFVIAIPLALAALALVFYALRPPADVAIDGSWIAEMQKPGGRPYRVRFSFVTVGERVAGSVEYPTGDGTVRDGQLRDGRLTFHTSHVPQFSADAATIRYEGEVAADEIRLVSVDDAGTATGTARRPPGEDAQPAR